MWSRPHVEARLQFTIGCRSERTMIDCLAVSCWQAFIAAAVVLQYAIAQPSSCRMEIHTSLMGQTYFQDSPSLSMTHPPHRILDLLLASHQCRGPALLELTACFRLHRL